MKKVSFLAMLALLFSCGLEDPETKEQILGQQESSSSSVEPSCSSVEPSSSAVPSSSSSVETGDYPSSSSGDVPISSSSEPSSSSLLPSSASEEPSSSSLVEPSSSSVLPSSSSSVLPSSSSLVLPSSSSVLPSSSSVLPSSSSLAVLSSSSVPSSSSETLICTGLAATGTVDVQFAAPTVSCNGTAVTAGLTWTPFDRTPTMAGNVSVRVSASSGLCSGKTAECGMISVALSSSSVVPSSSSSLPSSSSGGLCAGFVDGTEREHYDKMKKQFCDARDGKKYVYVTIGTQTWMAENLNYRTPDGASRCYPISGSTNPNDDDNDNCDTYGRLYDWNTAMNGAMSSDAVPSGVRGVCPVGWHLPSRAEWEVITTYIGGASTEGIKLKAPSGWNNSGNGTDNYGFSALPGGEKSNSGSSFSNVGAYGRWWITYGFGDDGVGNGSYRYMHHDYEYAGWGSWPKSSLFSVRCLQD